MTSLQEFKKTFYSNTESGFSLDYSKVMQSAGLKELFKEKGKKALEFMAALEKGAIANPDENRMVGHYWLRDPDRAPTKEVKETISSTLDKIKSFAADVHTGKIKNSEGENFESILVIGIGGSALGPQFVHNALAVPGKGMKFFSFDNTDPNGMDRTLKTIGNLSRTLCIVISKSGGTKETRNGQLVAKKAFDEQKLSVSQHFIAVTGEESELDKTAVAEKWLERFPMWDWVGGRTSELSAVGLVPAALEGFDITEMLAGARMIDDLTRSEEFERNPAMIISLAWYQIGEGKGLKDMVILPYKDRLELFSKYLQQLVMESLGKEKDLDGEVVEQGIAVYGNKGSTDQHAYVQQLRDGIHNFFVTFIEVLEDGVEKNSAAGIEVEPGTTNGDFLNGFYLGTRKALWEKGRQSLTLTIKRCDAYNIGMLIALFERAVGFYATHVNVNAYHQPGVEAGKKAAGEVIELKQKIVKLLEANTGKQFSVEDLSKDLSSDEETTFKILCHLAANGKCEKVEKENSAEVRFFV